jgi:hypothetical protein
LLLLLSVGAVPNALGAPPSVAPKLGMVWVNTALGILIDLKKKVDAVKGQLVLCGVNNELMKAWTSTHLHKMFKFCPTNDQALAVLGVSGAG